MIRAVIIDNGPDAMSGLKSTLEKKCREDVEIVAVCCTSGNGKFLLEQLQPDLVFIEIKTDGSNGIDMIRNFKDPPFRVVFVTANDGYAVEAFELNAIGYLREPVREEKLIEVIQKMKDEIANRQLRLIIQSKKMQKQLQRHLSNDNKIGISSADKIVFITVFEILYCEAHGAYTTIHFRDGKKILSSRTLGDFETQLGSQHFFRIHHSILINLRHVREFQRGEGGYVILENNERLEVSQRKRKDFLEAIDDFLL